MRSRRTIETGTVQNGLKLTSMILLLISGEGRSGLPTTAVWRDTTTPFSIASICAAGMLQTTKRGPRLVLRGQPRDVGAKLREPHLGRHVERLEGLLAHDAVDADAVARLEAAHRRLDVGIENIGGARSDIEVADRRKARPQCGHARMPVADAQPLDRRHRRPAAAPEHLLVAADGRLGVLCGRGRERRQRRLRQQDGARGGIEILAELGLLGSAGSAPAERRPRAGGAARRKRGSLRRETKRAAEVATAC